ncbi:MAG: tetratricopeptide repeat protein [Bacteroidales bacterium]|nr:tetratricopeptide repeat protein [Bacteroidales bacterium]
MKRKSYLSILMMAVIFAFTSCNKQMGPLSPDLFKCTPNPLEVKAGKVEATIEGTIPAKFFNKKAEVTVTPVLVFAGKEVAGTPVQLQGEKVQANGQVISYLDGGKVAVPASFVYEDAMRSSELFLTFAVKQGKLVYQLPRVKVADGVLSTSEIASATSSTPALAADKFQRIIKDAYKANILFLIQQANLRASELKSESVQDLQKNIKATASDASKKLTGIEVSSYASPDGALDLNTKLAEKREKNTLDYLNKELKKGKVSTSVDSKFTAEDWDGFKELMSQSNIQDKELVLRVLSTYNDPAEREAQIKNISVAFSNIAKDILPQLRRSRLTATYDIIGKSDAELVKLAAENPKALTIEELLYAATVSGANKAAIYKSATEVYPSDYRGFNNLGMVKYQQGKLDEAETLFNQAKTLNNTPEVSMNLGLIALNKNQGSSAEELFGKAAGAEGLGEGLGVLYLKKGEYDKAVNAFGATKSNNAAVAQILVKDYNKAKNTLAGVSSPDATTSYLMAVVGARTNNEGMVLSNLKDAISKDKSKAQKALTDIEFSKFNKNLDFLKLIQ